MVRKLIRGFVIGAVTALVGLVFVDDSLGFCNWFQKKQDAAAAMYGGTVCNPCGQQLTCNYVPQTCYRVQYVQVPVTTYRPVVSCDPCSGCQTVCMKPTTCMTQRAQYIPYTTYRLVYSVSQPACAPATTSYYAPTVAAPAAAAVAPGGCSSCGTGVAATSYYAPTAGYAPRAAVAAPAAGPVYTNSASEGYSSSYRYAPTYGATVGPAPVPASSYPSYSGPTYVSPGATYSSPATVAPSNGAVLAAPSLPMTTTSNYPPSTPAPVVAPAPAATPTPAPAPAEKKTKAEKPKNDDLTPIPDPTFSEPKSDGPSLNKTSAPRLFDPQDKTAAAWPTRRAWGYAPVVGRVAARADVAPVVQTSNLTSMPVIEPSPITLGPIVPTTTPSVDANGWGAANR